MKLPTPGLRGKLALSICLVLLGALVVTFFAVYRGTGAELEDRIEAELQLEADRLESQLQTSGAWRPEQQLAQARQIIGGQSFGPSSRVISITIEGAGTATNQPGLLAPGLDDDDRKELEVEPPERFDRDHPEERDDHGPGSHDWDDPRENAERILDSDTGYSTVEIDHVGEVRLLTVETMLAGGVPATIRVGQPLASVDDALEGLGDTFLLVGLVTLVLGGLAGWLLANSVARPMRRMAGIAEGVDGGELSTRMPIDGTRDEARQLALSFNGMLDRLEDAFDRQRAFVADASHDLRTPLTVVKGQIEVLARDPDPSPEEVGRVSELVGRAIARMELMVDDLLLLARAESAEGMQREAVELEPLLAGEVEGIAATADRELVLGEVTSRTVTIDREQISRAVSNLISNAVAHTEPGGKVEVSAFDSADTVTVVVDDDGPGVPPEARDRVFDRFARLDESRSSASGGSGLGLAIVKAIAESHGGRVDCSDSPLGGARFRIILPAG